MIHLTDGQFTALLWASLLVLPLMVWASCPRKVRK